MGALHDMHGEKLEDPWMMSMARVLGSKLMGID